MNRRVRQKCLNEYLFKQKDKRKYHAAVNSQNVVYWCGCGSKVALECKLRIRGVNIRVKAGWCRYHYFLHKQSIFERNTHRGIHTSCR